MAGRNLWLLGIWLEHVLKKIAFHDRYKEFTDELANAHAPELCLERYLPDHVLREWQFSCSLVGSVLHPEGQVCQAHLIRSRPLFVRRCRLGLLHWTRL